MSLDNMPNECSPCHGNGEIDGQSCPYCNGLGASSPADAWDGEDEIGSNAAMEECPMCGDEVALADMGPTAGGLVCNSCLESSAENAAAEAAEAVADYHTDMKMDSRRMGEGVVGFDRFMDRIMIEENRKGLPVLNDSPLRKVAARYQERPMGKTRMGVK